MAKDFLWFPNFQLFYKICPLLLQVLLIHVQVSRFFSYLHTFFHSPWPVNSVLVFLGFGEETVTNGR